MQTCKVAFFFRNKSQVDIMKHKEVYLNFFFFRHHHFNFSIANLSSDQQKIGKTKSFRSKQIQFFSSSYFFVCPFEKKK